MLNQPRSAFEVFPIQQEWAKRPNVKATGFRLIRKSRLTLGVQDKAGGQKRFTSFALFLLVGYLHFCGAQFKSLGFL